jgi:hypothetical protein
MITIADSKLPIVREENESKIEVNQNSTDESVWQDTDDDTEVPDDTEIPSATEFRKTKPPSRSTLSALKMRHVDWKERHEDCGPVLDGGAIKKRILKIELIEASLNKEIVKERRIRKNKSCVGLAREHQHDWEEREGRYWGDFLGE